MRNPLVLLTACLFILTCASPQSSTEPQPAPPMETGGSSSASLAPAPSRMAGPCTSSRNADRPIVCVDDSEETLSVRPDPFVIHERHSSGSGTPAVTWFTTSGKGDLKIVFADERCVRNVTCSGGRCTAVAAKLDAGEKERRCKYDVELTGHPTLDPEGVLTGCCVLDPDP